MASEQLLATSEVAARFGVVTRTVIGWIEDKLIPARKIGRDYVICEDDLAGFEPPLRGRPAKIKTYQSELLGKVTIPEE